MKGNREDATQLRDLGALTLQRLLATLQQTGPGPLTPMLTSTPVAWGGV